MGFWLNDYASPITDDSKNLFAGGEVPMLTKPPGPSSGEQYVGEKVTELSEWLKERDTEAQKHQELLAQATREPLTGPAMKKLSAGMAEAQTPAVVGALKPVASELVEFAKKFAADAGKPDASKFVYDWIQLRGMPKGEEAEKLKRAVQQGYNVIGSRWSTDLARDEEHIQKIANQPERLSGEQSAFHVDITPGAPGARTRGFNVERSSEQAIDKNVRPYALRIENPKFVFDEDANTRSVVDKARRKRTTALVYTPTEGELGVLGLYPKNLEAEFGPGRYQPAAAVTDPTAVRSLEAEFKQPTKPGLMLGTVPLVPAAALESRESSGSKETTLEEYLKQRGQ